MTILKKYVMTLGAITFLVAGGAGISFAEGPVTQTMGPGSSGTQVSNLQEFLAKDVSVYPEGLVTGYYGNLTMLAVQKFQCKYSVVCSGDVATTGYGRVGPSTLAKIQSQQGGTATGGGTMTGDVDAPIITSINVATSSTSAILSWNTNESANSRVMYGRSWPFLVATAPSVASLGTGTVANVTISGLTANTTYYYILESTDTSGNVQWGIGRSFVTGA
jgi:peptidoglycan hydrolase-like protein with peptidoglycan-binding domain